MSGKGIQTWKVWMEVEFKQDESNFTSWLSFVELLCLNSKPRLILGVYLQCKKTFPTRDGRYWLILDAMLIFEHFNYSSKLSKFRMKVLLSADCLVSLASSKLWCSLQPSHRPGSSRWWKHRMPIPHWDPNAALLGWLLICSFLCDQSSERFCSS